MDKKYVSKSWGEWKYHFTELYARETIGKNFCIRICLLYTSENFITKFERNTIKKLQKYGETLNKEKANLEKQDFFNEENIGIFWGLIETRCV